MTSIISSNNNNEPIINNPFLEIMSDDITPNEYNDINVSNFKIQKSDTDNFLNKPADEHPISSDIYTTDAKRDLPIGKICYYIFIIIIVCLIIYLVIYLISSNNSFNLLNNNNINKSEKLHSKKFNKSNNSNNSSDSDDSDDSDLISNISQSSIYSDISEIEKKDIQQNKSVLNVNTPQKHHDKNLISNITDSVNKTQNITLNDKLSNTSETTLSAPTSSIIKASDVFSTVIKDELSNTSETTLSAPTSSIIKGSDVFPTVINDEKQKGDFETKSHLTLVKPDPHPLELTHFYNNNLPEHFNMITPINQVDNHENNTNDIQINEFNTSAKGDYTDKSIDNIDNIPDGKDIILIKETEQLSTVLSESPAPENHELTLNNNIKKKRGRPKKELNNI